MSLGRGIHVITGGGIHVLNGGSIYGFIGVACMCLLVFVGCGMHVFIPSSSVHVFNLCSIHVFIDCGISCTCWLWHVYVLVG